MSRTGVRSPGRARIEERTLRQDRWWLYPAVTFVVFAAFVVYATWRAFAGARLLLLAVPLAVLLALPGRLAASRARPTSAQPFSWWRLSPALIILIFPLGFRMSCYYYRKAYYRAFWLSPPACAVAEPHGKYSGETPAPADPQQHPPLLLLRRGAGRRWCSPSTRCSAFRDEDGEWGHMGLGTLVLLVNVVLIWAYTLGCHSCRHAVGGRLRHFSKHPVRYRAWTLVSKLNAEPRPLRLAVAVLRGARRPLRLPARHRRHLRPEVLLMVSTCSTSGPTSPDDRQPDGLRRATPASSATSTTSW